MAALTDLINQVEDKTLRERLLQEAARLSKQKKFGLVFEEHIPECTPLFGVSIKRGGIVAKKAGVINDTYRVTGIDGEKALCLNISTGETESVELSELVPVAQFGEPIYPTLQHMNSVENAPDSDLWHTLIEADNYHALQLLEYLYPKQVDCIYIDPPYNTGARDWKYNNDYVDSSDSWRHSKWLSMMQKRLKIAKRILNPKDSVLIVTIDEREYLHLGCLLEEMFPGCQIQMISVLINRAAVSFDNRFGRSNEYIFIVYIGTAAPAKLPLEEEWNHIENTTKNGVHWVNLCRTGTNNRREDRPGMFYPIFVSQDGSKIVGLGDVLPLGTDRNTVTPPNNCIAVWPIHTDSSEGRWMQGKDSLNKLISLGYVKLGRFTPTGMAVSYLNRAQIEKIEAGQYHITGYDESGTVILDDSEYSAVYVPDTQWNLKSHDAARHGTNLLQSILKNKRFTFPKSLYATHDTIRFFVTDKPGALIVDFFAGSGTTLHAVNLLNAEDGGHRRCIMVTNNEVSADEAKSLTEQGYQPDDPEWEKLGIAQYVTWPRTVCSIEGHDINGNPLNGNYIGSERPMAEGFPANCEYFKLGFLDKNNVALGKQFKEILPLLWLKACAVGKRPEFDGEIPDMLILSQNKMAVLTSESGFMEFEEKLEEHPEIETVFIVTDSERAYREMILSLKVKNTYQLYRDYLDNFRINARR